MHKCIECDDLRLAAKERALGYHHATRPIEVQYAAAALLRMEFKSWSSTLCIHEIACLHVIQKHAHLKLRFDGAIDKLALMEAQRDVAA